MGTKMGGRISALMFIGTFVVLSAPAGATAQHLEVGGGISQITNPPAAFFDGTSCPAGRSWAGEGRVGYRFSKAVALEATGSYHWAGDDVCIIEPTPIPPSGPFSETTRIRQGHFPFVSTDARLSFEPSDPSGPMWLRAFGGYGIMWSRDTGYWLAGGGIVFGQQVQSILEVEWNWFSVPFDDRTSNYVDGALVSSDIASGSTSHSTFRLRAGFRIRP